MTEKERGDKTLEELRVAGQRIIVALDCDWESATRLAKALRGKVWGFKLGSEAVTQYGMNIVHALRRLEVKVMVDTELKSTPRTIGTTIHRLVFAGVEHLTLFCDNNDASLRTAIRVAGANRLVGTSVLSSLSDSDANELHQRDLVPILVDCAKRSISTGLINMTCPARLLQFLDEYPHIMATRRLDIFATGVRTESLFERDDHFQVATPADAIRAGAKFVIMGRPFTVTDNPLKVAEEVSEGIRFALLERDEL